MSAENEKQEMETKVEDGRETPRCFMCSRPYEPYCRSVRGSMIYRCPRCGAVVVWTEKGGQYVYEADDLLRRMRAMVDDLHGEVVECHERFGEGQSPGHVECSFVTAAISVAIHEAKQLPLRQALADELVAED